MSLRINPEYDRLLPQMAKEEFAELKRSIQSEGQHYPIIVNENLEVLDGHHRFRACIELGIEPDFEVKQFEDKLIEKKFVIEANLRRRHLNNFQLIELAVPLLAIEKALAKRRQSKAGKNGIDLQHGVEGDGDVFASEIKGKATEVVAKKAGLSSRTLERGKKIIESASEEEKQKLREGKTSISRVYQEIINEEKPKLNNPLSSKMESELDSHNTAQFLELVKRFLDTGLHCPSCGNAMFECSRCHKTIKELINDNGI